MTKLPSCLEAWPECESGKYDPRCCRFPKSCSPDEYDNPNPFTPDINNPNIGDMWDEEGNVAIFGTPKNPNSGVKVWTNKGWAWMTPPRAVRRVQEAASATHSCIAALASARVALRNLRSIPGTTNDLISTAATTARQIEAKIKGYVEQEVSAHIALWDWQQEQKDAN